MLVCGFRLDPRMPYACQNDVRGLNPLLKRQFRDHSLAVMAETERGSIGVTTLAHY
jgi:hypothetical protein